MYSQLLECVCLRGKGRCWLEMRTLLSAASELLLWSLGFEPDFIGYTKGDLVLFNATIPLAIIRKLPYRLIVLLWSRFAFCVVMLQSKHYCAYICPSI